MIFSGFTMAVDGSGLWFVVTDGVRCAHFEVCGQSLSLSGGWERMPIRVGSERWAVHVSDREGYWVVRPSGELVADQAELLQRFGRRLCMEGE